MEKELLEILLETTQLMRKTLADFREINFAEKNIENCEDPSELTSCLNHVEVHGKFKPRIIKKLNELGY
jgi:hypothetical protein